MDNLSMIDHCLFVTLDARKNYFPTCLQIICSNLRLVKVKSWKNILFLKLFWPFTVSINCSSDLKKGSLLGNEEPDFKLDSGNFQQVLNLGFPETSFSSFHRGDQRKKIKNLWIPFKNLALHFLIGISFLNTF